MLVFVLVAGAILTFAFILVKIRHEKMKVDEAMFWFFLALALVILSVFPQIAFFFSNLLDIESPSNFVFLCVIAILVVRGFYLTIELSSLKKKVAELAQDCALRDLRDRES